MKDYPQFAAQMLRRPRQVMALAPSSSALAVEMTVGLGPTSGKVVELGAGSGKITRMILSRGVAASNLTVIERNAHFAQRLKAQNPGLRVEMMQAEFLSALGLQNVTACVSGLPLRTMGPRLQLAVLSAAFEAMAPDGWFAQFSYAPAPPVHGGVVASLGLALRRGPIVWGNLPPASVYFYHRQTPRGSFF
jgi:phosphatidylethanolamine/phosphatidyl-N-methylethanolamine N-methyltransferase